MVMNKQEAYQALVRLRMACSLCVAHGYKNQAELGYDTGEVGNYSAWANDLEADVLIVAQDFSNQAIYVRDKGLIEPRQLSEDARPGDYSTETNFFLRELTKVIGRDMGLPTHAGGKGVFLTNAVLCLKPGAMNAANPAKVIANCGARFLRPLVELIQPKVIVTLGAVPARSVLMAYATDVPELAPLRKAAFGIVCRQGPYHLPNGTRLYPMYHPGRLGQSQRQRAEPTGANGWELMKADWRRMNKLLK